ncbi:MAG: AAA family ATPase [Deltaproteobacteria bacterium]|nr:AAA family ATPase [Deltaproteobacteria bacterium]MBW2129687.1 AAA family ATPase [Deltaproteobacteria bacterium]MBW2304657.1 AAA family ATPase [Deltaproteobacteria bacterium]
MPYSIGLAGKGGTGKTTIAGFLVKYLLENGKTPILAVDADANANFNEVLGLEVNETLGDAREEMKKGVATGMTKDVFMEMKLEQAVVESEGFDLIVMGRPEGAGCYCAANTLLTTYLDKLIKNYKYVVMDNEAGMEHLSRLTTNNIDILLIVSDPSRRGLQSASRIVELSEDLNLDIRQKFLIVNQVRDGQMENIRNTVEKYGLNLAGFIPEDEQITEFDLRGRPTIELDRESKAVRAAFEIFQKVVEG